MRYIVFKKKAQSISLRALLYKENSLTYEISLLVISKEILALTA